MEETKEQLQQEPAGVTTRESEATPTKPVDQQEVINQFLVFFKKQQEERDNVMLQMMPEKDRAEYAAKLKVKDNQDLMCLGGAAPNFAHAD